MQQIIDLNQQLAAIEIMGEDAIIFLQGQLTNDIKLLQLNQYQLSAYLNPKGRIIANFLIIKIKDYHFQLLCPQDLVNYVINRFKIYVLRSKVSINLSLLKIYLVINPQFDNYFIAQKLISLDPQQQILLTDTELVNSVTNIQLWKKLLCTLPLPLIYNDSKEKIIPQQINLDLLQAISFNKGCYTGQEIVARIHYLGKSKRRLFYFESNKMPTIGQIIISPAIDNQEIGMVVDFYYENEKFIGLASLIIDWASSAYLDNSQEILLTKIK